MLTVAVFWKIGWKLFARRSKQDENISDKKKYEKQQCRLNLNLNFPSQSSYVYCVIQ